MAFPLVRVLGLALALLPALAHAEPRTHDGVYLRFGIGPGYTSGSLDTPTGDSGSSGIGVNTQLAIGWTPRPGLVVGIGTFPGVTPGPDYDGIDAGGQHISATGPFVDYYLSPTRGVHGFAGLLFTAGYLDGGDREGEVGVGFGATAGVGYDHFVSDEWSIGVIGRVTLYQLYGVEDSVRLIAPAGLISVTRH